MPDVQARTDDEETLKAAHALVRTELECAFGPGFFLGPLRRFVRDRCPDPKEDLPVVAVHLVDGERLDVCHIVGVSPRWVMFAVRDPANHRDGMAVEVVPYEIIRHVRIGSRRAEATAIGFAQTRPPEIIPLETLLPARKE